MEAIFLLVDIIGIVLLLYWSIVNDGLKPGEPVKGLFAYRNTLRRRPAADSKPLTTLRDSRRR